MEEPNEETPKIGKTGIKELDDLHPQTNAILFMAARSGNAEGIEAALMIGADVNAQDEDGRTPLMNACYDGFLDVVKLLLDREADLNVKSDADFTALDYACKNDQTEIATVLSEKGGEVGDKDSVLFFACSNGSLDIARLLIANGADVSYVGDHGMTNLMYAAWKGYPALARWSMAPTSMSVPAPALPR